MRGGTAQAVCTICVRVLSACSSPRDLTKTGNVHTAAPLHLCVRCYFRVMTRYSSDNCFSAVRTWGHVD